MTAKLEEAIEEAHACAAAKEVNEVYPEGPVTGRYKGLPVQFERSTSDRSGTLTRALTYFAGMNEDDEWPVPVGAWLDGASIPQAFWSIIGGPYTGKYFPASVVHDHYCIIRTRNWQETHRMFHAAMRTSGVGRLQAKLMFYAVYRFGPRWDMAPEAGAVERESSLIQPEALDQSKTASVREDLTKIIDEDLSLEEIEVMAS